MSTQKPSKKSGNCRCSGGPPAEWFWEVILCLPDTAVRAESAKKTPPFGWCFWSGRRGSNSLPGIPRMAVAIRRSPASPQIKRASHRSRQRVLRCCGAFQKRKSHPDGWDFLFWSGRRGSNSLPGIPRMAVAIRRSPASPQIKRASHRSRQRVLRCCGAFQKRKSHPDGWDFLFWSGRRGSNSLPRPWQGRALPDELRPQTQD